MSQLLKQTIYKNNYKYYLILVRRVSLIIICTFTNKEERTRAGTNMMITSLSAVHFAAQSAC